VKQKSVAGNSAEIVDSFDASTWKTAEYTFSFQENLGPKVKSLKVLLSHDDSIVSEQVFAKQGSPIDLELNTSLNGSNIEVQVVNNESYQVDVSFARLRL